MLCRRLSELPGRWLSEGDPVDQGSEFVSRDLDLWATRMRSRSTSPGLANPPIMRSSNRRHRLSSGQQGRRPDRPDAWRVDREQCHGRCGKADSLRAIAGRDDAEVAGELARPVNSSVAMVTRTLNTSGLGVSRKGVASSRSEMASGGVERRAKGARGHHFWAGLSGPDEEYRAWWSD